MLTLFLVGSLCVDPVIIPIPVKLSAQQGQWPLIDGTNIYYDPSIEGAQDVAQFCHDFLTAVTGYNLPLTSEKRSGIMFTKSLEPMNEEAYKLTVNSPGVTISALSRKGLYYGFTTLLQLFTPDIYSDTKIAKAGWVINCIEIEDYPRFQWRGLMIDAGRHFLPVDVVKRIILHMSYHKLNTLHWHLTEDQGWRIEIKKHPKLTEIGSVRAESPKMWDRDHGDGIRYGPFFYSREDVKDVLAYAKLHCVKVVPEVEMPGHSVAAIASYPELSCTGGPFEVATRWGVKSDTYCPGKDATLQFNQDILDEVIEMFDSEYIHVGGDEVLKDRWKNCKDCQARIKAEGLADESALQSWFTAKMSKYIDSKGRHLIGWDEIIDGGPLADGAAVMSWRGVEGGQKAASLGHNVVMSPTNYLYFDYGQTTGEDKYEYFCCLLQLKTVYGYEPLTGFEEDKKKFVLGVQGNLWGECIWGEEDLQWKAYPRSLALAEVAWSPLERKDYSRFLAGYNSVHIERLKNLKINYAPFTNSVGNKAKKLTSEFQPKLWAVTEDVQHAGKYQGIFVVKNGNLKIKNIDVLVDGKVVVRQYVDGVATENNAFVFDFYLPVVASDSIVHVQTRLASDSTQTEAELFVYENPQ